MRSALGPGGGPASSGLLPRTSLRGGNAREQAASSAAIPLPPPVEAIPIREVMETVVTAHQQAIVSAHQQDLQHVVAVSEGLHKEAGGAIAALQASQQQAAVEQQEI